MDASSVPDAPTRAQHGDLVDLNADRVARWLHRSIELTRAAHRFRRQLKRHTERHGLGDRPFLALWMLSSSAIGDEQRADRPADQFDQGTLATTLGVSPAQLSAILEQLRRRQLVESCRSTVDRRRQHWRLTAAGRSLLRTVLKDLTGVLSDSRRKEAA